MIFDFKNPDYKTVWERRAQRLKKVRASEIYYKELGAVYLESPADFINDWGTTFDPRRPDPLLPFILFPKQVEYCTWLKERLETSTDGLVEKSRDMGLTWLNMAFSIWLWLFFAGRKIGFGSRKEMLVDRLGDPDSIFEKGRLFLKYLPPEFRPFGFTVEDHCPYLKIINPANGSTITGEAGDNIGRGGRSTIYFKDESAFYERPDRIEAALSMNSDVKIDVSTPNGTGNPFYQKRVGGKISVFTFSWRDDPRKDESWYKKQRDTLDPVILAQEVDIDYNTSTEMVTIPSDWVKAAVDLRLETSGMKIAGLDVADEGADENALIWRHGVIVQGVESWKEGNTTQTTRKAYGICKEKKIELLRYDSVGVGAGVKGEIWSIVKKEGVKFLTPQGINTGSAPTKGNWAPGKPNSEMFRNLKAQAWFEMRRRFQKTYDFKTNGAKYPIEEMISIPNDPALIIELSQPKYSYSDNGKIVIEKKEAMRRRGIKSPNRADALIICFAPMAGIDYALLTKI